MTRPPPITHTLTDSDAGALWAHDTKNDEFERVLRDAESSCALLRPSPRRFVLFPIQHRQIWDHYKSVEHSFWTAEDLHIDDASLSRLPTSSRTRICKLLDAQLHTAQQLRSSGIVDALAGELQAAEARCYFGFQGMLENIHIEAISFTLMTFEPPSSVASTRHAVEDVDPLLLTCTSSQHAFMRRLIVYAVVLDYYHACTTAAYDFMQLECPALVTLFSRLSRDIASFSQFTKLLCRMILPPSILRSNWVAQLSIRAMSASVRAFPNLSQPSIGHQHLADVFTSSLSQSSASAEPSLSDGVSSNSLPTLTKKETERMFIFATDEDF